MKLRSAGAWSLWVAVGVVLAGSGAVLAAACMNTPDPRPGVRTGGGGGGGGGSTPGGGGGSGLDAAPPQGPIECGPAPGAAAPFTKQALLGAAADCAAWHACTFLNAATTLRTSVRDHAAAPSSEKKTAAQAAWRTAMNEWSKLDLFQFGPLASTVDDQYHGRGLRTFIHSWPDLNRCQVETQVVTKAYEQGWDLVFPSSRGLYAVEYLLHYPGSDTACLAGSSTGQTWAAQSAEQLAASKNAYAVAVADNLVAIALEVDNVWKPTGENFKAKLLAFDKYGSEQEALNVVAWALIYVENDVKDRKLASHAGVKTTPPTPETPFALIDVENVRTNLRAFRSLFQGCGAGGVGLGFDDWLIAAGQQTLAQDMLTALDQAQAAADAFPPFHQASQAQFAELYDKIRVLADYLKSNFFGSASPLNLKLPASVASDTD